MSERRQARQQRRQVQRWISQEGVKPFVSCLLPEQWEKIACSCCGEKFLLDVFSRKNDGPLNEADIHGILCSIDSKYAGMIFVWQDQPEAIGLVCDNCIGRFLESVMITSRD